MASKRRPRYGGEYGDEEISPRDVTQSLRWANRDERLALAHAVAIAIADYRFGHALTQQQLAATLGLKQPQVARLESGIVSPTLDTLMLISEHLELDFTIDVKAGRLTASATPRRESRPA